MKYSLLLRTEAWVICLLLFAGCILMVVIGKFLRGKFVREDEGDSRGGVNSLLGALFGLWAFLLAFTFGNSSSRFENVRNTMVEETNGLRSAIMRADVFTDSIRAGLRNDLKEYIDTRIGYFKDRSFKQNGQAFYRKLY